MFNPRYFAPDYFAPRYWNKVGANRIGVVLEAELTGRGNGWTDLTNDLVGSERLKYGLPGTRVTDRVAITGELHFGLDNSAKNSALKQGSYSPNHANVRAGFRNGIRVRYSFYVSGGVYFKFLGTLDDIVPTAGTFEDQTTYCTAVDYIDDLARSFVEGVPVQVNQRSDQLFSTVLATMDSQPNAIEVQTGLDTYPYALDDIKDEKTSVLSAMQYIALSELGLIYVKGDRLTGGTLVFESRSFRPTIVSSIDTFSDKSFVFLEAPRRRSEATNAVQTKSYPRKLAAGNTSVLYDLQTTIRIPPGSTQKLLGPYRDPANPDSRIGAQDFITPVANTDYVANAQADGLGANLTANLSVVANFGGNGVRWALTNNGGQDLYVTKLQCRGRPVFAYDVNVYEASDANSISNYGKNLATLDMRYQSDPRVAEEAAIYVVQLYKDPLTQVPGIQFSCPNTDLTLADRLLRREISDRISFSETVTGITTSLAFFINAIEIEVDEHNHLSVSWLLAPADTTAYWLLEVVGRSELGVSTRLGFGLIVGHTDVAHGDAAHGDVAHSDSAHGDSHTDTHTDAAHGDSAHTDTAHADTAHSDNAHADTAHVDTAHADTAHADSHSDVTHQDVAHTDAAHGDAAHTDTPHEDSVNHEDHDDAGHVDQEVHSDQPHSDVAHSDSPHDDTHSDVAHADTHQDAAHSDVAHVDTAHGDTAHVDTAHVDTAHGDTGHVDGAHQDEHGDVAHVDVNHGDSHTDVAHLDTAHGDIN